MIYVINYYSTLQNCNEKRMVAFYTHISQCTWTVHISFKLNIPLNGQPSTCLIGILHVYFVWILYIWGVSNIHIYRRLWLYGFTCCVYFNVPDTGTIWDGTVHALHLNCVPPCFLFILDCQRKWTLIHKYIVTHTPLFHCTVHNFGCLTCVSPQWNRLQCEHMTTPWRLNQWWLVCWRHSA